MSPKITMKTKFACHQCGETVTPDLERRNSGYAFDRDNSKICFQCCAKQDAAHMKQVGKIDSLYLTLPVAYSNDGPRKSPRLGWRYAAGIRITNWPGSLVFATGAVKVGRHNWAGYRFDVWFTGPDGEEWHGVSLGDSDLLRCRRVRRKSTHRP
jgi:hypothetical protein